MRSLLYLVHRLPYPPNKGDKITSFNMLKFLSQHFVIYLGVFVDDKNDWQYIETVKQYCKETCFISLTPNIEKILSLRGIILRESLSVVYYRNSKMQQWVDSIIDDHDIDSVLVISGPMAQYMINKSTHNIKSLLDLVDVDSDKWEQYAKRQSWPMNWLYKRESRYLLEYEATMAKKFDSTMFVSKVEAELFTDRVPAVKEKILYRTQGVDSQFFNPKLKYHNYYKTSDKVLVFIGVMDYWPNVDAVIWFAKNIFPKIHLQFPEMKFYIVGMNPSVEVKKLETIEGVVVTGGVDDIRPYLIHAVAALIPLRIARGIQNKILEAMAMEVPVIATRKALQGFEPCPDYVPIEANSESEFVVAVKTLIEQSEVDTNSGRTCILEHYNWDTNLKKVQELLS
jgi:polysaccharide biosynthesis protein PslH